MINPFISSSITQTIFERLGTTKGYVRKTLRVETYKALVTEFPGLRNHKLMRLFVWLIFGRRDKLTGMPLVGSQHCNAAIRSKNKDKASLPILEKMQKVLGEDNFAWGDYDRLKKECRSLTKFNLPNNLIEMLKTEISENGHLGKRVYLSGIPYRKKETPMEEINILKEKDPKFDLLKHSSQGEVLEYLNELDPKYFKKVYKYNYSKAFETAKTLKKGMIDQLCLLHCLWEDEETPFYTLSESTYRIYPVGYSLVQLKSSVRKVLCKDWYEVDLKSAQLAIIARLWNIPKLKGFLEAGQSFWNYCLVELDLEINEDNKAWLKELTYALAFGAGELGFKGICVDHQVDFSYYQAFRKIGLVAEIFEARKKRMHFFRDNNFIHTDCFGVVTRVHPKDSYKLLAREAQAIEWLLMQSLFKYVKSCSRKEIDIVLWQHDGVCLFIKREAERHFQNINSKLSTLTKVLDIPTHFEFEKL